MKRFLPLLFLALLCCRAALAEETPEALFRAAHPNEAILTSAHNGDLAAALLDAGDTLTLCVAERQDGEWRLSVDAPRALRGDQTCSLAFDGETLACLVLADTGSGNLIHYRAARQSGVWTLTDIVCVESSVMLDGSHWETTLHIEDGLLTRTRASIAATGEHLLDKALMPLPLTSLSAMPALGTFDLSRFDSFFSDYSVGRSFIGEAAAVLSPGDELVGGALNDTNLKLLVRQPDGALVFVGVTWDGGFQTVRSAPLPEDAVFGHENFSDYLYFPSRNLCVGVAPFANGAWGVNYLYSPQLSASLGVCYAQFFNGQNQLLWGDHAWGDLTAIDWDSLPESESALRAGLETADWALVNNPNPDDRLNLRTAPSRDAASLGRFYTSVPVRILSRQGEWAEVECFGLRGWMMRAYLAEGDAMTAVPAYRFTMTPRDYLRGAALYDAPGGARIGYTADLFPGNVLLLASVDNEGWFYLVDCETGLSAYSPQNEWWPGNG